MSRILTNMFITIMFFFVYIRRTTTHSTFSNAFDVTQHLSLCSLESNTHLHMIHMLHLMHDSVRMHVSFFPTYWLRYFVPSSSQQQQQQQSIMLIRVITEDDKKNQLTLRLTFVESWLDRLKICSRASISSRLRRRTSWPWRSSAEPYIDEPPDKSDAWLPWTAG